MKVPDSLKRTGSYLKSLVANPYFYVVLAGIGVLGLLALLLVSRVVMPTYTRHSVFVSVPDVTSLSFEEARARLKNARLEADERIGKFRPDLPRDVVIEQNPHPNTAVKPGRTVYLTVNSGTTPTVVVPNILEISVQEAQNRVVSSGLKIADIIPDPHPSPYVNTVTKISPPPGSTVEKGSSVTIWYSTGLGSQYVDVPDVVGMTVVQAKRTLYELKLRAVAIDATADSDSVARQSRPPGTRVREGFEIRLFVTEAPDKKP